MDRDSTGATPSVLCPRQAAGLANNKDGKEKGREVVLVSCGHKLRCPTGCGHGFYFPIASRSTSAMVRSFIHKACRRAHSKNYHMVRMAFMRYGS